LAITAPAKAEAFALQLPAYELPTSSWSGLLAGKGFVNVDKWKWGGFLRDPEQQQRQLVAVLDNDLQATELK
jgi:hypothetical protein